MPPLMAKKMPFVMTFAWGAFEKRGTKDEQKMMFIDVRKAHLNGVVDDQEWVLVDLLLDYRAYGRFARIRQSSSRRWASSIPRTAGTGTRSWRSCGWSRRPSRWDALPWGRTRWKSPGVKTSCRRKMSPFYGR